MLDYPAMYRLLLAAQADAIDGLKEVTDKLIKAHRQVEEMYREALESDTIHTESRECATTQTGSC